MLQSWHSHCKNGVSNRQVKETNKSVYLIVGGWEMEEDERIVMKDEAHKGQMLEDRDGHDLMFKIPSQVGKGAWKRAPAITVTQIRHRAHGMRSR